MFSKPRDIFKVAPVGLPKGAEGLFVFHIVVFQMSQLMSPSSELTEDADFVPMFQMKVQNMDFLSLSLCPFPSEKAQF